MKDMLGNELAVGDPIIVKYGNEWVTGIIAKLQNGGLSLGIANPTSKNGQSAATTADVIVFQVTMPLAGPPGKPQPFLARLDTKSMKEEIIESTIKM